MAEQSRSRWFLQHELMNETNPALRWLFIGTVAFFVAWFGIGVVQSWRLWGTPPSLELNAMILGNELLDRGDLALAEREFRALEEVTPWSTAAIRNRARILEARGEVAAALAAFARAVAMGPADPTTHYDLGAARYRNQDLVGALASFEKALELEPHYYEALEGLGSVQMVNGRAARALDAFQRAVALRSDSAAALRGVGAAHAMRGEWREATEAYRAALERSPGDPDLENRLRSARQKLGEAG